MGYEAPPAKEQKVSVKKITTADAARCLGKSKQFVRIGLQRGLLPFGNAVPGVAVLTTITSTPPNSVSMLALNSLMLSLA